MKVTRFFIFFIYLFSTSLTGQGIEEEILELNRKKLSDKDSVEYNRLKEQMARYINPKPDSALYYIHQLKKFSIDKKYSIGLVDADYLMANYYRRLQQHDSAISYFKRSLTKAQKIGYTKGIAVSYNGICHIKYIQGKNDEAIDACLKCTEIAEQTGDPSTLADTYIALGNIYVRKNHLNQALRYYLKVDSLHTVRPLRPIIIAAAYQSIGDVYLQLKEYDKSEEYFLKANNEFKKLPRGAEFFLNTTNWHLGEVYFHKNQLDKADSLLQKSYQFFNAIQDRLTLAQISIYLGRIKMNQNQLSDAEKFLLQGYELHHKTNNPFEASQASIALGNLSLKQNRPDKAIYYFKKSIETNKIEKNSYIQQASYKHLSDAYALKNDFKNAFYFLKKASHLKDSLNKVQNAAKIRELETIYQTEKKEKEIALLNSKNKIIAQQKRNQRNLFFGIMGFISLLALFLFSLYKNRQKIVVKLQELDQIKSDFFANISHEFRTPLTLILSPVKQRLKQNDLTKEDRNLFQIIQKNADRLLDLVNQVLDLTKLESGKRRLKISCVKPDDFFNFLANNFESLARQKNITYRIENQCKEDCFWLDKDVVQKIINNLLSNSFKYTEQGGHVKFSVRCENGQLIIMIKNTGKKLNKEDLNRIFERFYQKDKHSEGIGLGLSIVKQLVQLHKGKISVNSGDDVWTTFQVILPGNKTSYNEDEIISPDETVKAHQPLPVQQEIPEEPENCPVERADDPILLIIEDNKDVRHYISRIFSDCFKIITAKDGDEGLEKAFEHIPDIIISDVMMPGKDGIEILKAFKSCQRTNHIPVILLTAKAGEKNKIEGLATGADDYIEKPFNEEILKLKVNNLLNFRKKIKEKIMNEYLFVGNIPQDIPDKDRTFFEHLNKVLDQHLTNPDFTSDDFASAMAMSRMQLHRKLKALTGKTTTQFLRIQRLNYAARLLTEAKVNISEIAYMSGFNDPGYFNKCFKNQFGVTPSEFKSQKSN